VNIELRVYHIILVAGAMWGVLIGAAYGVWCVL